MSVTVTTIVGARPQFVKAAVVSRALAGRGIAETLVHTGQHFDAAMSGAFFEELGLPEPAHHLGINGGTHAEMTGRMLMAIEAVLMQSRPNWVLIYGDTNSTLAGALAAAKLAIPVAHVEAGLRSFRRTMPEEINRVAADHMSSLLLCPTETAIDNLRREGIVAPAAVNVGDVMYDAIRAYSPIASARSTILRRLNLTERGYAVLTIHRAENTASPTAVAELLTTVAEVGADLPIVFPIHPRTRALLSAETLSAIVANGRVTVIDPIPYLDSLQLQANARLVMTDSGGMQKEAYLVGVRCLTLRDETEWPETLAAGMNVVIGSRPADLRASVAAAMAPVPATLPQPFGDGTASDKIAALLESRGASA